MNVILVNPAFKYFPNMRTSKHKYCRPSLGMCYVASYLRKYALGKCEIRIFDALAEDRTDEEWIETIAGQKPDLIGFSVATPTMEASRRMALELKSRLPHALIVAGGAHATMLPDCMLGPFDAVVVGEGEATFFEIARNGADKASLPTIKGVAFQQNGVIVHTKPRGYFKSLDEIPFPARDLLPIPNYYHTYPYNRKGGYFGNIITCRGCPRNCYFCGNKALWQGNVRFHSLDYVLEEIKMMVCTLDMSLVFIEDDDFLVNKKRAMEFCERVLASKLNFKWIVHACADGIEEESLRLMKRAGCVEFQIGVESGDEGILKQIDKSKEGREVYYRAFRLLKKYGLNSWATIILGHTDDTEESIERTIDFAKKIDPTYASFIIMLPFPGSQVFEIYKRNGWLLTTDWSRYSWYGDPVFELPHLSAADLVRLRAKAMTAFYLRPSKIFRYLWQIIKARSLREFFRNVLSWHSLVTYRAPKNRR